MNTEIENYLNNKKLTPKSTKLKQYLTNLLSKFLLSIIFLMLSIILIKSNTNIKNFYQEDILTLLNLIISITNTLVTFYLIILFLTFQLRLRRILLLTMQVARLI